MTPVLNETHDVNLRSWVESAHDSGTDFPIQNLPYGRFRRPGDDDGRVGVAIGDQILDLHACEEAGLLEDEAQVAVQACVGGVLNGLMALGPRVASALRLQVSRLLREEHQAARAAAGEILVPMADAEMLMPVHVGDYTDFYASVHHATNVGSMFRPDNPLLPNYKWLPVGYHGRASSVVVSGTDVVRPKGQTIAPDAEVPTFQPCRLFDYELEVGFYTGAGNPQGQSVPLSRAEEHIFGLSLVNDWSARDIQKWEYQPLGPFLAKSFATSVSPWIVSLEALAPFRCPAYPRPEGDPQPLEHLYSEDNETLGGVDLRLEVLLNTESMRAKGMDDHRLSQGNFRDMYWTMAQMLTHHSSNGCNLRPGDLLASGTVSGPEKQNRGCMLELSWRGSEPIELPTGEERKFLQDGDEVVLRGRCEADGVVGIGFGECRGRVLPSRED